ncbi:MAG: UDP-N-acetylmuramoyl-L-alanine--D-glutamate ligase [Rickettsiales bacterium]|jgi:UDP-N-acetylmuramoylalanine--D-glutamate ligase|nr:UDP-N-acetylmuramoyl-L-alanine--D-glutamate ligase [Rickettsiales bacterium]
MINGLLNKTVAVFGLGRTGMAVVRELKQRGVHIIAWDAKEELRREAMALGAAAQDLMTLDFSSVELLVISPGIAHTHPAPHPVAEAAKKAGVKIVSDIELFVSTYREAKYIGITGTNGKSTTTALIHHILKSNGVPAEIGGNFGIPVFDLPRMAGDGYYVLELSSYQLELTPSLDLDIAVLLNITPDHLSRHNGMEGYIAAKKLVFRRARKKNATNVVAVDDENTRKIFRELSKDSPAGVKNISVSYERKAEGGYYANAKGILFDNTGAEAREILDLRQLDGLKGKHNRQNVAAAFAACRSAGIAQTKIAAALKSFRTLDHRMQTIGKFAGVTFINDSKATNAESVKHALDSMDDIYWILGGRPKEGGIDILRPQLARGNIKRAFAIGECEKQFYAATKKDIPSYRCGRLDKAVMKAFKYALKDMKKGKAAAPAILLSPATASFDQYKSFEERGEHFARIFEDIKKKYRDKFGDA